MQRFRAIPLLLLLVGCGGGAPTDNPPPPPNNTTASVTVSGPNTVAAGSSITLQASAANASGTPLSKTFTWTTSASSVATVNATGVVTGVAEGTAVITATADGIAGNRTVTVQGPISTVTITGATALRIGQSQQLTATARTASGAQVTSTFNWSTNNADVATVSSSGLVTATGVGTATIGAQSTVSGTTGNVEVTVTVGNLDQIVATIRQQHDVPALVGAIVTRTYGTTAIGVAGNRRIGGPVATINDKWHIGSNLKGITAALAGIAVKAGQITWTTTVASMFPEFGGAIREEYRTVTLRELLSMQGGIRNDPPSSAYTGANPRAQRENAAAWGLAATPQNARGVFYYSNISYVIAGAMIERAMGGTFEALLVSRLGTPVGATQIGFGPTTGAGGNDQPVGHSWNNAWVACEACDNPPGLSAAGRAHMSMSDWARITRELMRADAGQSSLLDQPNAREIFTGVATIPGGDPYGLGWNMTTRPWGGKTAMHSGSNTTNHSVAWVGLDNGVAFLAATNASDLPGTRSAAALEALVARMLTYYQTGQ